MNKKALKSFVVAALSLTMISGIFVGCGKKGSNTGSNKNELSGTITTLGSTALQPLVQETAINFQTKYPNVTINVQGGGSGAGINQVSEGSVEIGNSDVLAEKKLKDKAKISELVDHKVCGIGFAMIVSKDVKVDSLTKSQIQDIFSGKITNWKDVGGENLNINIINRPKSSGTRSAFVETVMDGKSEKDGLGTVQDSSGSVDKAIQSTKGSISYLALSYLTKEKQQNVKMLKIGGIEPTKENIVLKKYTFWAYEHMYTKGNPTGLTKSFIDYMMSNENKSLIEKLGYISVMDLK